MEFVAKHKHKIQNHRTHAERQQNERKANEMHSRIDKIPFRLAREQHESSSIRKWNWLVCERRSLRQQKSW